MAPALSRRDLYTRPGNSYLLCLSVVLTGVCTDWQLSQDERKQPVT